MANITVGIDSLGCGFTEHYLSLRLLAEARGIDPAKYEKGLGCLAMGVPAPTEDTVTLAAAAGAAALRDAGVSPDEIGLLIVGTETAVDHAKPVASYVQGLLGIPGACRVYEIKHACYGGTAGVLTAAQWIASGAARGKKALVIASDIARYGIKTAGEPTQGAGAAAMIVAANPRLVAIDFARTGAWSRDVHDFWRPLSSPDALVDGALSLNCYTEALTKSFAEYAQAGDPRKIEEAFEAMLFHVPFVKMTEKGHRALLEATRGPVADEELAASYAQRVRPSLKAASLTGNAYTASLWLGLAAAIVSDAFRPGASAGFYSYGSGFCGEFFAGTLLQAGAAAVPSFAALEERKAIDVRQYEEWMAARLRPEVHLGVTQAPYVFVGTRNQQRVYERLAVAAAA